MIRVNEAIESATRFFQSVYVSEPLSKVRVEEVELSDDGSHWLITLGYNSFLGDREYKTFTVRTSDGEVLAMKIREVTR